MMQKIDYPYIGETIYRDTLPNGLQVSVVPKPGYSRSFALFATKYGGADRRFRLNDAFIETPLGVAHFLEHKMFDMPSGENALSVLAANGAQPNAYTSSGMTAYHFESTANFDMNLRTLLKFVSTPYFTEESVAKEQGIIGQEIRMTEDNPGYAGFVELLKSLYSSHPMRESVAGTVESIAQITPEVLYHCHEVFYNPSNMVLCCGGDVDPDEIRMLAEEMLPKTPGEIPERDYGKEESLLPVRAFFEKTMEVSAPQFLLGAKLPFVPEGTERLRQGILAELSLDYLAGTSSEYYTTLYSKGILNHDFGAELYECAGTRTLILGGESKEYEKAKDELLIRVNGIREGGLDKARFGRCKRAYFGAALSALDSVEATTGMLLDSAFGGWNALEVFSLYDEITDEEVSAFLTDSFQPERLALSVIQPC